MRGTFKKHTKNMQKIKTRKKIAHLPLKKSENLKRTKFCDFCATCTKKKKKTNPKPPNL